MTYPRLEKQFHNPCPWLHNNLLKTLENTRHRRKLSTSDARHTRCNMARTFVRTISTTCEKKRQLNIKLYAIAHHALSTRLFQRSGPTATRKDRFLNFVLAVESRGGGGTRYIPGWGGAARPLIPWPCLRQISLIFLPCLRQNSDFWYPV